MFGMAKCMCVIQMTLQLAAVHIDIPPFVVSSGSWLNGLGV